MDSVMDCVKVQCFRSLRQIRLACGSAILSIHPQLEILLGGVCYHLTEQFSESGCMVSFLESCLTIVHTDLRIAFAHRDTAHCQIHANLRALAIEVCTKIFLDVIRYIGRNTDNMLRCPCHLLFLFSELGSRSAADRALLRCSLTLINITAYIAYPLCHN